MVFGTCMYLRLGSGRANDEIVLATRFPQQLGAVRADDEIVVEGFDGALAFAKVSFPNAELVEVLDRAAEWCIGDFTAHNLAVTAWAFAKAAFRKCRAS